MKVIVSHDVDHMWPWDHRRNLVLPKFVVRFGIEWLLGQTRWNEVGLAIRSLWSGPWQRIEEVMDFDTAHGVPSTFFVAMAKGRKLCYSLVEAQRWAMRIRDRGFDVGVHGIAFRSVEEARRELTLFRRAVSDSVVGVRIHNIGYSPSSVLLDERDVLRLRDAGYSFSTTTFSEGGPWSSGRFWEFPVHLMDSHIFQVGRPWKTRTLEQTTRATIDRLRSAADRGVRFFSLLFHDAFFSDHYRDYRDWYVWVIGHLRDAGYALCSYRDALEELR